MKTGAICSLDGLSITADRKVWEFPDNLARGTFLSNQLWRIRREWSPEHLGKSIICK